MNYKLGRQPRAFSPRIPQFASLFSLMELPAIPVEHNWALGMPKNLGAMLNLEVGDCTSAAFYHFRQIWRFNNGLGAGADPDADVLDLYRAVSRYNPGDPATDVGATCQAMLQYLTVTGAPIPGGVDKILGFLEVDVRNREDAKRGIYDCGGIYTGMNVPAYIMDNEPPFIWRALRHNRRIVGGHCVVLCGYDDKGFDFISWGQHYYMTNAFFDEYVDEAYPIMDSAWFGARGETPFGLTLALIQSQMSAIKVG